jgi:hypothetical protein
VADTEALVTWRTVTMGRHLPRVDRRAGIPSNEDYPGCTGEAAGAWADSSGWDAVIARLQRDGYTVYVPPNPLLGLRYDPPSSATC